MKKKLVLKFDGMHTEKKGYISFMFERYLFTHERFDFIK